MCVENDDGQHHTLNDGFDVQYPSPVVVGMNPSSGQSGTVVNNALVAGDNFRNGVLAVRLERAGQADIVGTDIHYVNQNSLTCDFNLAGADEGDWDLKVAHTDDTKFGVNSNAFLISQTPDLPPTVNSITPSGGENTGTINITNLSGEDFDGGAIVKLTKSGQSVIYGSNVDVVSSSKITCNFNISGVWTGDWNVTVENPGGKQDTLEGGFAIYAEGTLPAPKVDCVSPGNEQRGEVVIVRGSNFDVSSAVQKVWFGNISGETITDWENNSITVKVPNNIPEDQNNVSLSVENTLGRSNSVDFTIDDYWDDSRPDEDQEKYPVVSYLAEGCSANGFETYILVQNPEKEATEVKVRFLREGFEVAGPTFNLPGESRFTVNMGDYAEESLSTATEVSSAGPVTVEKAMYWGEREGGHGTVSSSTPSKTWYLAEGSTGGDFSTYLYVVNPSAQNAFVRITYMTPNGEVAGPEMMVPSRFREAVNVADVVPGEWSVSTLVQSDIPVVVERCMYWKDLITGHNSIGVTSPSENWYLAEGSTGGDFETWVLAQNPGQENADVSITYMTETGEVPGPSFVLGPLQRMSFNVADTVPDTWSVSTKVESNKEVVAERAMYWNDRKGAHDSIGVKMPETTWCVPEGCTGGDFETWILVQNPEDTPSQITFTYMTETGPVAGPEFELPANSRKTINVAETVPDCWSVSTMVDASAPVIVERAVYWQDRVDGHDTVGIPLTKGE